MGRRSRWVVLGLLAGCGDDVVEVEAETTSTDYDPNGCGPREPFAELRLGVVDADGQSTEADLTIRFSDDPPIRSRCTGFCRFPRDDTMVTIVGVDAQGCARLHRASSPHGHCAGNSIDTTLRFDDLCGQACPLPDPQTRVEVSVFECAAAPCDAPADSASPFDGSQFFQTHCTVAALDPRGGASRWTLHSCTGEFSPTSLDSLQLEWSTVPPTSLDLAGGDAVSVDVFRGGTNWAIRDVSGALIAASGDGSSNLLEPFEVVPRPAGCDPAWDGQVYEEVYELHIAADEDVVISSGHSGTFAHDEAIYDVVVPSLYGRTSMHPDTDSVTFETHYAIARRP